MSYVIPAKVLFMEALFSSFTAVAIAEIGDKTQIATVLLAASFEDAVWYVIWGTTLGMLAANVPVVYAGSWLLQRIPLNIARYCACAVFMVIGVLIIFSAPGL